MCIISISIFYLYHAKPIKRNIEINEQITRLHRQTHKHIPREGKRSKQRAHTHTQTRNIIHNTNVLQYFVHFRKCAVFGSKTPCKQSTCNTGHPSGGHSSVCVCRHYPTLLDDRCTPCYASATDQSPYRHRRILIKHGRPSNLHRFPRTGFY